MKKAMRSRVTASKPVVKKNTPIVFKLHSPGAKKVSVAGDFNNWDTSSLSARKDVKGIWSVEVSLKPGKYEYKFIVDGSWIPDPSTPVVGNIYGSQNSIVIVK